MGFTEVLFNLRTILHNIKFCRKDILEYKPDALILVDYPGFNLRIAEFAHHAGIKVMYYISPQVWAWKQSRVKKIKLFVDRMFVILPFEKKFYKKHNFETDFVGHPLLDAIEQNTFSDDQKFRNENGLNEKPIVALLPGSRKQEISKMLPVMISTMEHFREYQFVIVGLSVNTREFYSSMIKDSGVKIIFDQTYNILQHSTAALVTSGTATLETALFGVPEVVCYKGSGISFWLAKRIVNVKYISLVNLILDREVVKELIQKDFTRKNLVRELAVLLNDEKKKSQLGNDYVELKSLLGGPGASAKTAEIIVNTLNQKNEMD
jgi:lipid-A-disaccharide synthase